VGKLPPPLRPKDEATKGALTARLLQRAVRALPPWGWAPEVVSHGP